MANKLKAAQLTATEAQADNLEMAAELAKHHAKGTNNMEVDTDQQALWALQERNIHLEKEMQALWNITAASRTPQLALIRYSRTACHNKGLEYIRENKDCDNNTWGDKHQRKGPGGNKDNANNEEQDEDEPNGEDKNCRTLHRSLPHTNTGRQPI